MIRFVVIKTEDSNDPVRLHVLGGCVDGQDYLPHQVVEIDAVERDVKWSPPPEHDSPLIGRAAIWNGKRFAIDAAYLKEPVGMMLALSPVAD